VATCLAAAIGSALMGLLANYPIALAPGMGLNAFFTYTVVLTMGYSWQVGLGAVFLSGVLFFLLDRKSTRLNSSHVKISYAVFCYGHPRALPSFPTRRSSDLVATCLAAAIGSALMGLLANYPIALAPGMGLNAFFTYTVVLTMGYSWQVGLGAVFLSGVLFFL